MLLGPWLLELFGIQTPVVRIAGGLVVTALGWKLLTQEQWSDHSATNMPRQDSPGSGSFYPLTMPLTVGPGSISVAVAIGSRKAPGGLAVTQTALHAVGALIGLLAIGASIYFAYRFAERMARVLGATGIDVLVRLSAFIMMCIGIEFVWTGYSTLAASLPR
jgi:multiple antibiotic resistance protein